jgi:hypothetical protein
MKFIFYIVLTSAFMTGIVSISYGEDERITSRIYKCERLCKERYESCALKASMKKGKEKNKTAAICESRMFDCRERCGKIK